MTFQLFRYPAKSTLQRRDDNRLHPYHDTMQIVTLNSRGHAEAFGGKKVARRQ